MDATGTRKLLTLSEILETCRLSGAQFRVVRARGDGPPLIRRPGGNRLLAFEDEILAWLESGRLPKKAESSASAAVAAE
jgi:hypothetical protein